MEGNQAEAPVLELTADRAEVWLALVASHPVSSVQTSKRAKELLGELEAELGAEEMAQVRKSATSHALEDVAKEALAAMQPE